MLVDIVGQLSSNQEVAMDKALGSIEQSGKTSAPIPLAYAGITTKRFLAWGRALRVPCSTRSCLKATCRYIQRDFRLSNCNSTFPHTLYDPLSNPPTAEHTEAIVSIRLLFRTCYELSQRGLFDTLTYRNPVSFHHEG